MKHFLLFFALVTASAYGQSLRAYWEENPVRIGDHAKLIVILEDAPKNLKFEPQTGEIEVEWKQSNENLWRIDGVLEVLRFKDTLIKNGKKYRWKAEYELIAWDSAYYKFPEIQLTTKDSSLSVQAAILKVGFVKKKINLDIDELKVAPEYENPFLLFIKKWWWAILGVVSFCFIIYFWNKRKRLKKIENKSLKQRYLEEVVSLRKNEYWNKQKTEKHYLEFTYLLKRFLTDIYELNLTSKTTKETLLLLNKKGIDSHVVIRIQNLLNEADMVKFAKSTSRDELMLIGLKRLEELIVELSPIETING